MLLAFTWRTRAPSTTWIRYGRQCEQKRRSLLASDHYGHCSSIARKEQFHSSIPSNVEDPLSKKCSIATLTQPTIPSVGLAQDGGDLWDSPFGTLEAPDTTGGWSSPRIQSPEETNTNDHSEPDGNRQTRVERLDTFIDRHRTVLRRLGYTQANIEEWRNLVQTEQSNLFLESFRRATQQLDNEKQSSEKSIPWFVLLCVASRPVLAPSVVQALLAYLDSLSRQKGAGIRAYDADMATKLPQDDALIRKRLLWKTDHTWERLLSIEMVVLLEVYSHLISHARTSWPEILEATTISLLAWLPLTSPSKSSSWTTSLPRTRRLNDPLGQLDDFAALAFATNAVLKLLAQPCTSRTFKNSTLQEASQVRVVQYMASCSQPLDLNRTGYRGIASVQLMLRKTPNEIRWTELQSLSWPPWKYDRTAMDSCIGPEHGVSNALQALRRMREVGYRPAGWEHVATVYTGWDDDGSPTVQTRQYLGSFQEWQTEAIMWSARIRTTRTIREAWAAFQAYWDSGVKWRTTVCQSMLEKILLNIKREAHLKHQDEAGHKMTRKDLLPLQHDKKVYPGEVKEIWPSPPSSHLETYTRTAPPSLSDFLDLMEEHKVSLDNDALIHLLPMVTTWDDAHLLLNRQRPGITDRSPATLIDLFHSGDATSVTLASLLLKHLLQFPAKHKWSFPAAQMDLQLGPLRLNQVALSLTLGVIMSPLQFDLRLPMYLLAHLNKQAGLTKYHDRNEGNVVEQSGLVDVHKTFKDFAVEELSPFKAHLDRIAALRMVQQVVETVLRRQGSFGPQSVVDILTISFNAAQAAKDIAVNIEEHDPDDGQSRMESNTVKALIDQAEWCKMTIASTLRPTIFSMIQTDGPANTSSVGTYASTDRLVLPRLQVTPSPAILHAAIRCFGAADDFEGISQTIYFMQEYWPEIQAAMEQDRNGAKLLRRTLCATSLLLSVGSDGIRRDLTRQEVVELFLEKHMQQQSSAPEDVVEDVYKVVAVMDKEWGGWPLPMEVESYIMHRKDRVVMNKKKKKKRWYYS
ncbi:hypothetical protein BDZ85DRAFT_270389 [Elsinoe ampelina]|uniref:Uncharacterized protein n=1 Tax=Elsinoe ampelina TaxID=302913 RepID=A0A6A6FY71_9PEZI|nr:hypothetical protein BDZ85DRAFT_270389 [Elsinoe ampelina]